MPSLPPQPDAQTPLLRPYRPSPAYLGKQKAPQKKARIAWFLKGAVSGLAMAAVATIASQGDAFWQSTDSAEYAQASLTAGDSAAGENSPADMDTEETAAAQPDNGQTPEAETIATAQFDGAEPEDSASVQNQAQEQAQNIALPVSMRLKVAGGDTLLNMLTDTGLGYEEAYGAVQAIRRIYDPKKLDAGQHISVSLDASPNNPQTPTLSELSLPISQTETVRLVRENDGNFAVKKIASQISRTMTKAEGTITSSLYETGIQVGIPAATIAEIIKVYSYDVDFQRDIKRGDRIAAVFERMTTEDGVVVGNGNLLYASLTIGGKEIPVYRFSSGDSADYYNAKGESLRKALLRTPINGARISSGFGMRKHPVLGYSKMHRGMDFAAPTGTPIYAAGDGTVAFAGSKGSYGNYVQIKHNNTYATAYAHASRIAPGIRPGMRVKQGQVIAYVGTTGRSTGPHLHYEVLASGEQINPAGIKFKTGNTLAGTELASFKRNVEQVHALLKSQDKTKVASNQPKPKAQVN